MEEFNVHPNHFNPRILYIVKRSFLGTSPDPRHAHDYITLIYVLSGSCQYEINDDIYDVKAGNLIILNPDTFHFRILQSEQRLEELHIGFNNLKLQGFPKDNIISGNDTPIIEFIKYGQSFQNCCEEILHEQERNDAGKPLMLKSLAMKLITLILKEKYVSSVVRKNNGIVFTQYDKLTIVNTIVDYINENYMKPISLTKISQNTYLSPVYISKLFKDVLGESPINYLIKYRLSKACELFEENETSIKTVAKKIGYEDAYYFSKLFKKYIGISPSKYMKADSKPILHNIQDTTVP